MTRTLVLYTFYQDSPTVRFFRDHGLFSDPQVDFVWICNHPTLRIPDLPAYVHYFNRDNTGFDFGGWSHGLVELGYDSYDFFIFVNASVFGPFMAPYVEGRWTDIFVKGAKHYGLFGSTINSKPTPHIQSYAFAMNQDSLCWLIDRGIFTCLYQEPDKKATIRNREIRMSKEILTLWNIGCLQKFYDGVDFRQPLFRELGDTAFAKAYMGGQHLHPYEVVFLKATRNYPKEWLREYLRPSRLFQPANQVRLATIGLETGSSTQTT